MIEEIGAGVQQSSQKSIARIRTSMLKIRVLTDVLSTNLDGTRHGKDPQTRRMVRQLRSLGWEKGLADGTFQIPVLMTYELSVIGA